MSLLNTVFKKQKDDVSLEDLSKLFFSESKKNATIVIDTLFGQKVFYLSDIKSVTLNNQDRKCTDITKYIIGGNE